MFTILKAFPWGMPASPIDFLADDWQAIEIDATPITPPGKDHPYVIEKPQA